MTPKKYPSPAAFKVALEDRLKKRAAQRGVAIHRMRQRFVMERFLARVVRTLGRTATLKGGLALELRLANARSTKDIDLRAVGDIDTMLTRLQAAATLALDDHLAFSAESDPEHPDIGAAVYEGRRFRVTATLAGQIYGARFGVDVAMGDPMHGTPDELVGEDFLDFVGVEPVRVAAYPVETHVAEKLHAYTRPPPPGRENSRVRDLPDLALLARTRAFNARELRTALETTFTFRRTHAVPSAVPLPPASWVTPYRALAAENALPWETLADVYATVVTFLGPVLAHEDGTWDPTKGQWSPG